MSNDHLMAVYNRAPLAFERGLGAWLYTAAGDAYLDCVGGVASNALGHCDPRLVAALGAQAEKVWHVSNMFRVPEQEALAARLVAHSFAERVFFANTGTEAVECALKTARRYHAARDAAERIDVIGFTGSFHGRTYAAINASGNAAYLNGFGPRLPGYLQLDIADHAGFAAAVARPTTAAVIIEPVQGEGGARVIADADLLRLRTACTAHGVLLIHDEVQCGMGRTGRLFAHQWVEGAAPDIMAVAKALGSGFPVAACVASEAAASGMTPGAHGTTFGGNPLGMAVALAAFDIIADPATLAHVRAISARLMDGLETARTRNSDIIAEIRGKGLLIGLKLHPDNRAFLAAAREQRLLIAGGGDNCVRLLPSLTLTGTEADEAIDRIERTCAAFRRAAARAA